MGRTTWRAAARHYSRDPAADAGRRTGEAATCVPGHRRWALDGHRREPHTGDVLWDAERVAAAIREHVAPDRIDEVLGAVAVGWVLHEVDEPSGVRAGGRPSLGPDERWPADADGRPLTFVAQVDLAGLPAVPAPWSDPRPPALHEGLLRVFAATDDAVAPAAALLRSAAGTRVSEATPGPALPERHAAPHPFLTLPEHLPGLGDTFPADAEGEEYRALTLRLRVQRSRAWLRDAWREGPEPWRLSHLFGHAVSDQDDTRLMGALVHPELPRAQDWTVLLAVSSGWGGQSFFDGGTCHVLAPTEDLARPRWDRLVGDLSSL